MENVSGFADAWIKAQKDFIENWMKAQKEFVENWVKSQKDFMENWIQAARKIEELFPGMGSPQDSGTRETFNLYQAWLGTMADSSKAFAEESGSLQETWKKTVEKQMYISSAMAKNFLEFIKKAAERK